MEEKCKNCNFKQYYGKNIFPCTKCTNEPPITCKDCRQFMFERCKKGLRPCKNFKWW